MGQRSKHLNLTGKFLLYTLPPMIITATVYLVLLSMSQISALQESYRLETHNTALRYSRILSRPLWNLEEKSVVAIMESLIDDDVILCAKLIDATGLSNIPSQGACDPHDNIIIAEVPIVHQRFEKTEELGRLRLVREGLDTDSELFAFLSDQIVLTIILLVVIIICAILGYRFTVTAPLKKITSSVKKFRDTGIREKVSVNTEDELGQFVQAYNNSLERQDEIENTLHQQVALQRVLLNTIPNAVAFLNRDNEYIGCNRAFSDMFDVCEDDIKGKQNDYLFMENPWAALENKLDFSPADPTDSSLKIAEAETTILREHEDPQIVILASAITRDEEGLAVGQVTAIKDITEQKRSEVALRNAKEEAEGALNELKVTQESLVQSEKLASLGSLVAGIAHEINTPLGSSITLASSIGDKTFDFKSTLENGQLKKSHLLHYLEGVQEASKLLDTSLSAAAELVHNFKQVAADQTSSKRREFDLKNYIEEIISTLMPSIKTSKLKVFIEIKESIWLDSYPGPLGQIITNMFTNSVRHAFTDIKKGEIHITGDIDDKTNDNISIIFQDNGCGIAEESVKKVFDPFYTTKMGSGGTGLGMNVVYNIVTKILGGSINIDSAINLGTKYTITIPKTAPILKNEDE